MFDFVPELRRARSPVVRQAHTYLRLIDALETETKGVSFHFLPELRRAMIAVARRALTSLRLIDALETEMKLVSVSLCSETASCQEFYRSSSTHLLTTHPCTRNRNEVNSECFTLFTNWVVQIVLLFIERSPTCDSSMHSKPKRRP